MRTTRRIVLRAALVLAAAPGLTRGGNAVAQTPVTHPLDIGGPPGSPASRSCLTDSVLNAAVTSFNGAAAMRIAGGRIPVTDTLPLHGPLAVYGASLRVDGAVLNDIIVINGDLRVTATGRVDGNITVLGGSLTVDPGAFAQGHRIECDEPTPIAELPGGTVTLRRTARSLLDLASGASFTSGPFRTTLQLDPGVYNRVEGLPLQLHPSVEWAAGANTTVRLDAMGILRTSNDASGARSDLGWNTKLAATQGGAQPLTVGVEGGSTVVPVTDQPYSSLESGLAAFVLRRDYRDWYLSAGGGAFAAWKMASNLSVTGAWHSDRETTLAAQQVFSLARNGEDWRPNPLIDDGKYQTVALGATLDTRDEPSRPSSGFYLHSEVRHVSSGELTPVSLPTAIRSTMPSSDYGETEMDIEARWYLLLDPLQSIHLRFTGGGWLSGDPLTVQRRRSVGSGDDLPGYEFREFNCDRRRRPDPALPALCDRDMAFQAEFRRIVNLNLTARIGGYNIGFHRPAVVVFGDAATAWLAGDSAGFVPTNRIQALSEWHTDVGVGLDGGSLGLYLAKAIAGQEPFRFVIRLTRPF